MAQIRRRIKTVKPESEFDKALEQELLSYAFELSNIINNGITIKDNFAAAQQDHILAADGTLADLTTKFNALLAKLETMGILKTS
jgi:hypothetical protein